MGLVLPLAGQLLAKVLAPGGQEASVGREVSALHIEGDIREPVPVVKHVLHKVLEGIPGHQGLVILEELLDGLGQGAVEAPFPIERALLTPRPVLQAVFDNLIMAAEAAIVKGRRVKPSGRKKGGSSPDLNKWW